MIYHNTFYKLRYVHVSYVKCLFANVQKYWDLLKISLRFTKFLNLHVNSSRVVNIKNATLSGAVFA